MKTTEPKPKPARSRLDIEVAAMKTIARALEGFDQATQQRILAHVSQIVETQRPSEEQSK